MSYIELLHKADAYKDYVAPTDVYYISEVSELSHAYIRIYDAPAAAGTGNLLDSYSYELMPVDDTVPKGADFAVRVSGDSMEPRFVDGQTVFVKEQSVLQVGEIGVFAVDGDAYIKKLGHSELLSLNPHYKPIPITEHNTVHTFGKVVG